MQEENFSKSKVLYRSLTAALGFFASGYSIGIFTSSQSCVSSILSWGSDSQVLIALNSAMIPLGAVVGSLLAGFLSKSHGKRHNLIIADLIMIAGSAIGYYPNTISFGIGRFISGIAVGCFSMLSSGYIAEFTPVKMAASMGSLNSFCIMCGILTANLVCLGIPLHDCPSSIRFTIFIIFLVPGFVAFLQLAVLLGRFKKESPYWLLKTKQYEKALTSIISVYDEEYAVLAVKEEIIREKTNSEMGLAEPQEPGYTELLKCKEGTVKSMRLGICFHLFHQLSGINAIRFYSTLLFEDLGEGVLFARILTTLGTFSGIFAMFIFILIIDKISKKKVIIICLVFMSSAFLVLSFTLGKNQLKLMLVGLIFAYISVFCFSIGPIAWMYAGLVMPDKGIALAVATNWAIATSLVFLFPFMLSGIGPGFTFLILAVFNLIASVYFAVDMVDPTGKSKVELREILSKMR